jgi:hypothetical protein
MVLLPPKVGRVSLWDSQEWTCSYTHTYLYFKGKIFLQVFNNHNEERKFNSQCLLGVCRTRDICSEEISINTLVVFFPTTKEEKLESRSKRFRYIIQ